MNGVRQVAQVKQWMARYPALAAETDRVRAARGRGVPDWPAWCFLPMAVPANVIAASGQPQLLTLADIGPLAALNTWRFTRGIYRVHERVLLTLANTPLDDVLPSEVLFRLPEWCVYIEWPTTEHGLHGYYAHLEHDTHTGAPELRLVLDQDGGLLPIAIHLGDWPVLEAVTQSLEQSNRCASTLGMAPMGFQHAPDLADLVTMLMGPVLYLCSAGREISTPFGRPGRRPERPKPTKTRHGWRLFPVDQVTVWDVGADTGAYLDTLEAPPIFEWAGGRDGTGRYEYAWIQTQGEMP